MNEKTTSEVQTLLLSLREEKCMITELTNGILSRVNEFRGAGQPLCEKKSG